MKSIKQLLIVLVAVQFGCIGENIRPSGIVEQEEYVISGYSKMELSDAFKATVEFGTEERIIIRADENIMSYVRVYDEGDKLVIRLAHGINILGRSTLEAVIMTANINSFNASGASEITVNSPIASQNVSIQLSGASRFYGDIDANSLNVELSGASIVDLSGNTLNYHVNSSGASTARDYSLTTSYLNADLSGASLLYATVTNEVDVEVSGASALNYKGDAVIDRRSVSGGSTVQHKN